MKILVSSMTFAPDHSGISLYATDFAARAAELGHEVTVVTGFSWYPKWAKRPEDRRKLFRTDRFKGVKVFRGYLHVPKKVSTLSRVFQEISFILFAFFNFFRAGKHEMIVIFTTPINLGLLGVFFQKLWGAKLVINVQDLQLDAAKSLGMLNKLPVVDMMQKAEVYSYQKADLVTSISQGMTDLISQKGIDEQKIYLWPNWIDVPKASAKGVKDGFRKKFSQYADKTIVGYAGNVGIKQGLSVLIELSEKFKHRDDIIFLIIGEGGDLDNLKAIARQKQLDNIHFINFLGQEDYFNFLTDADIVFLSQMKDSGDVYFPSKLLGIMAKEKMILVSADKNSELYKVVSQNRLGLCAAFGDIDQMESILNTYLLNRKEFEILKSNAFAFVQQFDREVVMRKLFNKIDSYVFKKAVAEEFKEEEILDYSRDKVFN